MDIQQGHSAVLGDPIELFYPDPWCLFAQDQEKGGILWQRIGQFHVTDGRTGFCISYSSIPRRRSRNPEWENGIAAVWLRFKRVCVKGRGVVFDIEAMQPVKIVQHESGTKTDCIPIPQIFINANCVL